MLVKVCVSISAFIWMLKRPLRVMLTKRPVVHSLCLIFYPPSPLFSFFYAPIKILFFPQKPNFDARFRKQNKLFVSDAHHLYNPALSPLVLLSLLNSLIIYQKALLLHIERGLRPCITPVAFSPILDLSIPLKMLKFQE